MPGPITGNATEPQKFCSHSSKTRLSPERIAYKTRSRHQNKNHRFNGKTTKSQFSVNPIHKILSKYILNPFLMSYFFTVVLISFWRTFYEENLGASQCWCPVHLQHVSRPKSLMPLGIVEVILKLLSCFIQQG